MATTYKVRYKNHCTPQEQIASGGRWYLDSDCGRKLTGTSDTIDQRYWVSMGAWEAEKQVWEETKVTLGSTGTLTTGQAVDSTPATGDIIAASKDFVYIKNTGSTDIVVSLDDAGLAGGGSSNGNYLILLAEGEAFASAISTSANVFAKTSSGTSTIEHFSII